MFHSYTSQLTLLCAEKPEFAGALAISAGRHPLLEEFQDGATEFIPKLA